MTEENKSLDVLGISPIGESLKAVTEGTVAGASAFLSRICLPAAEEYGLFLKERVSSWRAKNATEIAIKAQLHLEKQVGNIVIKAHPRIVYSIIENGSWAEDDFMQSFWAGLLATSCSPEGKDESNLIFIGILSKLTSNQGRLIKHSCELAKVIKSKGGWIGVKERLFVEADDLKNITGYCDYQQMDRELDHLRSLELIHGGFNHHDTLADITPSSLCLQLYVRSQGYVGSPIDYFGLTDAEPI